MDWHEAQDYCASALTYPAHLIEVFNYDQHLYLYEKVFEYEAIFGKRDWGIGLVNLGGGVPTDRWIWSNTLRQPSFTMWDDYQTNYGEFAVVMSSLAENYKWTDVSFSHRFYPICQFDGYDSTTTTPYTTPFPTTTTDTTPFPTTTTDTTPLPTTTTDTVPPLTTTTGTAPPLTTTIAPTDLSGILYFGEYNR